MQYNSFLDWLINTKNISRRAAKDVVSRCRRICNILNVDAIDADTLQSLNNNAEFIEKSMFIKSQLRRAIALWLEFGGE